MKLARTFGLLAVIAAMFLGCGGNELSRVEEIGLSVYPANVDFDISARMTACSDACATYETPECSVDIDEDENEITLNASVCYERTTDDCPETCGPAIMTTCRVSALAPGTYTVRLHNDMTRTIEVR